MPALIRISGADQGHLVEGAARELQADGQSGAIEPAGQIAAVVGSRGGQPDRKDRSETKSKDRQLEFNELGPDVAVEADRGLDGRIDTGLIVAEHVVAADADPKIGEGLAKRRRKIRNVGAR